MSDLLMQSIENLKVHTSKAQSALSDLYESKIQLLKVQNDLLAAKQRILSENRDTPEKLGKNEAMREATINQTLAPLVEECSRLEEEVMEKNVEWLKSELSYKTWKSIVDSIPSS